MGGEGEEGQWVQVPGMLSSLLQLAVSCPCVCSGCSLHLGGVEVGHSPAVGVREPDQEAHSVAIRQAGAGLSQQHHACKGTQRQGG